MDTYAKQMNKTADYPWTTFLSHDKDKYDNPKHKGNKEERVNKLSRDRFEREFYKLYPKGMTLNTNKGYATFLGMGWRANYTNYVLAFAVHNINVTVKHEGKGQPLYYSPKGVEFIDDSLIKVVEMLRFNEVR